MLNHSKISSGWRDAQKFPTNTKPACKAGQVESSVLEHYAQGV